MSSEISKDEWRQFVQIASAVLEAHPDKNYTKTVASALDDEVLIKYQQWTISPLGASANVPKQAKFVLDAWKSLQTNDKSLDHLLDEFDNRLTSQPFATKLRHDVRKHFKGFIKENPKDDGNKKQAKIEITIKPQHGTELRSGIKLSDINKETKLGDLFVKKGTNAASGGDTNGKPNSITFTSADLKKNPPKSPAAKNLQHGPTKRKAATAAKKAIQASLASQANPNALSIDKQNALMETLRGLKMETCFETLRDAGIDRNQFWQMDEKDLANMGHTMGMRLRYRKGKKERDEMLRTMKSSKSKPNKALCIFNEYRTASASREGWIDLPGVNEDKSFITTMLIKDYDIEEVTNQFDIEECVTDTLKKWNGEKIYRLHFHFSGHGFFKPPIHEKVDDGEEKLITMADGHCLVGNMGTQHLCSLHKIKYLLAQSNSEIITITVDCSRSFERNRRIKPQIPLTILPSIPHDGLIRMATMYSTCESLATYDENSFLRELWKVYQEQNHRISITKMAKMINDSWHNRRINQVCMIDMVEDGDNWKKKYWPM